MNTWSIYKRISMQVVRKLILQQVNISSSKTWSMSATSKILVEEIQGSLQLHQEWKMFLQIWLRRLMEGMYDLRCKQAQEQFFTLFNTKFGLIGIIMKIIQLLTQWLKDLLLLLTFSLKMQIWHLLLKVSMKQSLNWQWFQLTILLKSTV